MPIRFYYSKNAGGKTVSYRPVAQSTSVQTLEQLAAKIAAQTGKSVADALVILAAVGPQLARDLAEGIETDWTNFGDFKPNITDASVPDTSSPLPTTARGDVQFTARGEFRDILDKASFEKGPTPSHAPEWESVTPLSGTLDSVKAGTTVKIRGQNMSFNNDPATRGEGPYLRPKAGGASVPLLVITATPQKLDIQVPIGTPAGEYELELLTRGSRAAASASLTTFIWPGTITVVT